MAGRQRRGLGSHIGQLEGGCRLHGLIVDFGGVLTSPVGAAIDAFCESERIERAALVAGCFRLRTRG